MPKNVQQWTCSNCQHKEEVDMYADPPTGWVGIWEYLSKGEKAQLIELDDDAEVTDTGILTKANQPEFCCWACLARYANDKVAVLAVHAERTA